MLPSVLTVLALCLASAHGNPLQPRAAIDNIVQITSTTNFCMIMPRDPKTNIGDSERPGGMKTYCSPQGRTSGQQGQFPVDFWSNVALKQGTGKTGKKYIQLTGCIRPEKLSRLNPNDGGGQYDSSGGAGGKGNPQGSVCNGYKHYVEIVEPDVKRACIKCCDDFNDCPLHLDTSGCPAVVKGNYFNCN